MTILVLLCITSSVKANESFDYKFDSVELWGNQVERNNTAIMKLVSEDGTIFMTYCVDFVTAVKDNHSYSVVNLNDASYLDEDAASYIRNIVRNAYPFISIDDIRTFINEPRLTKEDAVAAAQAAIWHYANKVNFRLGGNVKKLYDYYLSLEKVNAKDEVSSIDIVSSTYYEEDIRYVLIEVDTKNVYDLEYSFNKDISLEYGIEVIELEEGILLKNVPDDAKFEVKVTGKQDIAKDVYFFSPKGGKDASQSLVGMPSGTINISTSKEVDIKDKCHKITINKLDSVTGSGISKVKFNISNTSDFSGKVIDGITDENGKIVFKNIPNGTWYIKEVEAKDGYKINDEVIKVIVKNKDVCIDVKNYPLGSIKIVKIDDCGNKLKGIYFDLYKGSVSENNLIKKDIVTDEDGVAVIENLDKGEYVLVETKTDDEHILNEENIKVNVEYGKKSVVKIENKKIATGSLIIRKVDVDTKELLKGSKIGVYLDEEFKELYLEFITDGKEKVIENLPVGRYYVKEIETNPGYALNEEKYVVDIVKNEAFNLEIGNEKISDPECNGSLIIRKVDVDTKELLKGSKIGVYLDEEFKELYLEFITDGKEKVIENLPVGRYYVKEIEANSGYVLNTEKYVVDIVKDETFNLEIGNQKIHDTASNHYGIFIIGSFSLIAFALIYIGYNLCLKRK